MALLRFVCLWLCFTWSNSCNRSTEPKQYPDFVLDYPHKTHLNTAFWAADSLKYAFNIVAAAQKFDSIYKNGILSVAGDNDYCLNQLVYLHATMGQWNQAMDWMAVLNTRRLSATGIDVAAKGDFYYNQGLIADYQNQPRFARDCFFKALECYKSTYTATEGHLKIATAKNTIGLWYSEFMLDSAYQYVQEASAHFKVIKDTPYDYLTKENELAQAKLCYFDRSNDESIQHYNRAILLAQKVPFKDSAFLAECHFNTSISLYDTKSLNISKKHIENGYNLIKNNSNPKYMQLYFYAQGEYLTNKSYNKDFKTTQDSLDIIYAFNLNKDQALSFLIKHPARYVFPELLAGNFYRIGLGDQLEANRFYLKAMQKHERDTLCSAYQMEMLLDGLAHTYAELEKYYEALKYAKRYILFNSALSDLKPDEISWEQLMQPDTLGLKNYLYVSYKIAGEIFLKKYYQNHSLSDLKQAYEIFELIHGLMDISILSQTEQAIHRIVQGEAKAIYSMAVEAAYELHKKDPKKPEYKEMAFHFMEKQKAYLLNNKIEQKRDSLLAENLRPTMAQIRNMYDTLAELKRTHKKEAENKLNIKLTVLVDSLSKKYPEIASFKPYEYNLATVQNKLKSNESILEYFVGNTFTYVMLCKKDTVIFKQTGRTETLVSKIDTLAKHFKIEYQKASFSNLQSYNAYIKDATLVSKLLLGSIYEHIDSQSQILIIPDKQINLVNFEALLIEDNLVLAQKTSEVKYHKLPYFIRRHLVTYSPSFRIHASKGETPPLPENPNLLALINPEFKYQFDDIEDLYPNANVNRQLIKNKNKFFKTINSQHIICIMAHGTGASDSTASTLFFGTKEDLSSQVTGSEVLRLNLQAPLVVLTSCESASGSNKNSEIAFTMSWYFLRAGAGTIISSYPTLNPMFSNKILGLFFKLLNDKKKPADALRTAKLEYLDKNYSSTNGYEPYYWASLICFE
jgi:CHAT domain-containing protein